MKMKNVALATNLCFFISNFISVHIDFISSNKMFLFYGFNFSFG